MAMRLGGPIFLKSDDPDELAREHRRLGYRAAYCPPDSMLKTQSDIARVRDAYAAQDVCIAEVGAWVNPLDADPEKAKENKAYIAERLALADELDARCCVDIIGSLREDKWDGAHPEGYGDDFFDRVVMAFREILDMAKPKRTAMTFETMPYYFLDNPDDYLRLLAAIDRPGVAVHIDMCNCVSNPRDFYTSGDMTRRTFRILGPLIRSCHLKDLRLDDIGGTVKFYETVLGTGGFDIAAYLKCADALPDCPVMLEHLPDEATYEVARKYALAVMERQGIKG